MFPMVSGSSKIDKEKKNCSNVSVVACIRIMGQLNDIALPPNFLIYVTQTLVGLVTLFFHLLTGVVTSQSS